MVGMPILLAVLVIVVPELLDGAGHRSRYPTSVDIPAVPVKSPRPANVVVIICPNPILFYGRHADFQG